MQVKGTDVRIAQIMYRIRMFRHFSYHFKNWISAVLRVLLYSPIILVFIGLGLGSQWTTLFFFFFFNVNFDVYY